jgi:uncharacterized membrane protein
LEPLTASLGSALGDFWNQHPMFQAMVGAIVLGAIGSGAYLTALMLGFLGEAALSQLRPKFEVIRGTPARSQLGLFRLLLFVFFGSGVAIAFQLPQGGTFAPVQAFVLGATWPTVVSQILAKTGETEADKIGKLIDRIGGATPGP